MGFRELREQAYYRHDPLMLRLLGQNRLPDVAISRQLRRLDQRPPPHLRLGPEGSPCTDAAPLYLTYR